MDPLHTLFEHLDRWRSLPAYQLERRADAFFSIYLAEALAEHTGWDVGDTLIPELPIKRDLIWPDKPSFLSVKVDYLAVASDRVVFVELKTDVGSRRSDQDHYLHVAQTLGMRAVLQGIVEIAGRSKARSKYLALLQGLQELGLVSLPDGLAPNRWALVSQVTVTCDLPIEVVYVQPTGPDCLDFETLAGIVERHTDPLSQRFAASLRRWADLAPAPTPSLPDHSLTLLAVTDVAASTRWYRAALGWPIRVQLPVYVELALPDGRGLGLYQRQGFERNTHKPVAPVTPGTTTATELYLTCADLDAAIARMDAAGATQLAPRMAKPWGDDAAYYQDPDGNVVVLGCPSERPS